MKNLILVIAASAFISLSVSAQKNVPAPVKTAFSHKFVKATDVKWGKEGKTAWEAEFKLDGKSYSANFDSKGFWLETEYSITTSEIPAAVKTTINKEYALYKIKGTDVSET
ncbi:MAG: PepSY-like domain-containing protein, partial [Paludibacter sp.]